MHPATQRIIEGTPARLRPAVEIVVRTVDDTFNDRVPGLAAEIAFFSLLSLPPLLLTVLAGVGFIGDRFDPGGEWRTRLAEEMQTVASLILSSEGIATFQTLLDGLVKESRGTIVGIGFLITIISASRALRVVTTALTISYDLRATRPPWMDRIWGLVLTLGALITAIVLGPLVIAGPDGGTALSDLLGGVPGLAAVWTVAYWPAAAVVVTLLVGTLYHVAAPWRTPFIRDLPGAALAMLLWLLGTLGLRVYVGQTIGESYAPIAAPLVILLWLYVSGFVLLLGAELNAEIEKMWPTHHRTDPAADPATAALEEASAGDTQVTGEGPPD